MKKGNEITKEKKWQILGFLKSNFNFSECGRVFKYDKSTISRFYRKYTETGSMENAQCPVKATK